MSVVKIFVNRLVSGIGFGIGLGIAGKLVMYSNNMCASDERTLFDRDRNR